MRLQKIRTQAIDPQHWKSLRQSVTGILVMGAAILLGANLASNTFAQIVMDPGVNYAVGQRPDGVAAADFDNDGDNDLGVVTNGATGNLELIEIMLNNGDGTFVAGPIVFLPNSSSPGELIAADLDGDLDPDVRGNEFLPFIYNAIVNCV